MGSEMCIRDSPKDLPTEKTMSRWLYELLKDVPVLKSYTRKWKEAKSFSSKFKTFKYLFGKLSKVIRDRELEVNAKAIKKALEGKKEKPPPKPGNVN